MSSSINVVDLFCGAGGLSYGFQEAGYNVLTAIDNDHSSINTYSKNIESEYNPLCVSINSIKPDAVLDYLSINERDLDLLIGGPPCRGFSHANRQSRTKNNMYNKLIFRYLEFIKIIKPKIFLLENVTGLSSLNNGETYEVLIKKIKDLHYNFSKFCFNCEDYGIPQKRERLILIGTRTKRKVNLNLKKKKRVSVKQAIDDLPELPNGNREDEHPYKKYSYLTDFQKEMRMFTENELVKNNLITLNSNLILKRYQFIKQGRNWRDIPRELMKNYSNIKNCHSSIYYRLKDNEPSITLCNFRKNMIIHPTQDRGLSVREAARIQSFPDNFIFKGGLHSQQQQVANAVPPKLSKLIADELLNYFRN